MEELMKKHGLTVSQMMLIASVNQLDYRELQDLEYIESLIMIYKEDE